MFGVAALPRTLDAARRDATHARRHVRLSVVKDLGLMLQRASDDQDDVAQQAEEVLAGMALRDAEFLVRGAAAVALADRPSERGLETLLMVAKDDHPYVVEMALVGLRDVAPQGHTGASRVVNYRSRDERAALRFQAVLASGRVLDDNAFEELVVRSLDDADAKVRYIACRVCDERFAETLPKAVNAALEKRLDDGDVYVPIAAAFVVGPRGSVKAREILTRAVNHRVQLPAPEDEQTLIELIGELGLTEGVPGLRAHARGRFGLVPGRFAWQAQVALARLGDESAIARIESRLRHRNADVRIHAATAVGAAGLRQLRPLVAELGEAGRLPSEIVQNVLGELEKST